MFQPPPIELYEPLLRASLAEDVKEGDPTTEALVTESAQGVGRFRFKEQGVWTGSPVASAVFHALDPSLEIVNRLPEGALAQPGRVAAIVTGRLRPLLTGERTALNFVQRLSGIATLTRRFVEAARGTNVVILDTRKTLPGWRALDKYAVRVGGGQNHRQGLYDQILIKDNHLEFIRSSQRHALPAAVAVAVRMARQHFPALRIEVEIEDADSFRAAVEAGADIIMIDNCPPLEIRAMIDWLDQNRPRSLPGRPTVEASGGITLANIRAVAETGVDWISVGALTHSAAAVDISLEVERLG